MKRFLLVSCAGLAAGAVTGWLTRPGASAAPAKGAGAVVKTRADTNTNKGPGAAAPAPLTTGEILKICGEDDGDLTLYEKLDGVPVRTLLAMLNDIPPAGLNFPLDWDTGYRARSALVERLARQDPVALARWLLSGGEEMVSTWTGTAMLALLEGSPSGAAAMIEQLEKKDPWAIKVGLGWLAKRDPEAALQKLLASPQPDMPNELAKWIAADPARSLAFANQHPEMSYFILNAMAERDPAELEKLAAGLTHPDAQHQARRVQFGLAAAKGDAETFQRLLEKNGIKGSDGLQEDAFETMARLHPEKVEALARESNARPELARPLLSELAASHPERAAAFLTSSSWLQSGAEEARSVRDAMMQRLSVSWSVSDPAAALTWLRALPPEQRAMALPRAGYIADGLPPEEWLSLSRGLAVTADAANNLARQSVARTKDPAVLAEWFTSFPGDYHAGMLENLNYQLEDTAAVAELSRRLNLPPPVRQ